MEKVLLVYWIGKIKTKTIYKDVCDVIQFVFNQIVWSLCQKYITKILKEKNITQGKNM